MVWLKEIALGVYDHFVNIMHGVTLAGMVLVKVDRAGLFLLVVVLPTMLVGTWIGWQLYGRLDEKRFRQALAVLLIASGATLVL